MLTVLNHRGASAWPILFSAKTAEPFLQSECLLCFQGYRPGNSSFVGIFPPFLSSGRSDGTVVFLAGKWFVSTGKDNLLNAWRTPYGASIFQVCRSIHSVCSQSKSKHSCLWEEGHSNRCLTGLSYQWKLNLNYWPDKEVFLRGIRPELDVTAI